MNINFHFLLGSFVTVLFFIAYVILYRLYKKVGRRCRKKGCGSLDVERRSLIFLADDETISMRSVTGARRWFVRRAYSFTFSICKDCGFIEVVRFNGGPFSVWHLWWVNRYHHDQLEGDAKLENILYFSLQDILKRKRNRIDQNSIITDTPDLKIGYIDPRQF